MLMKQKRLRMQLVTIEDEKKKWDAKESREGLLEVLFSTCIRYPLAYFFNLE